MTEDGWFKEEKTISFVIELHRFVYFKTWRKQSLHQINDFRWNVSICFIPDSSFIFFIPQIPTLHGIFHPYLMSWKHKINWIFEQNSVCVVVFGLPGNIPSGQLTFPSITFRYLNKKWMKSTNFLNFFFLNYPFIFFGLKLIWNEAHWSFFRYTCFTVLFVDFLNRLCTKCTANHQNTK